MTKSRHAFKMIYITCSIDERHFEHKNASSQRLYIVNWKPAGPIACERF